MRDLSSYKHIHMIGIGGIGISAIAEIFLSRGYRVTGSDMNESDMTAKLRAAGATVYIGHDASQIGDADLVVYSSAIHSENPERKAADERGIESVTRAEALGALMNEFRESIAIAGTHGKTTTTSMVSLLLAHAGMDPTILVGGNLGEIGGNCQVGGHEYFVTEACEYMDSFLSLRPHTEIITNIDSDHLDYFKDIEHIVKSFDTFVRLLPEDGLLIAFANNAFVTSILPSAKCRVITFGFTETCDYYSKNIAFNGLGMPTFDLYFRSEFLCHLELSVPGEHNIANALAAAACARSIGIPISVISSTLENFAGTERRFDILGVTHDGKKVIDDYAHHPTEIRATLKAVGNIPHKETWCVFQPHTYTRTLALFDAFSQSFDAVDHLILADIYAAREKNIYGITSENLAEAIRKVRPTKDVRYIRDFSEIAHTMRLESHSGDLLITMGAGDVYKIGEEILQQDQTVHRFPGSLGILE